ncbi:MAG: hypothetical protein JWN40_3569 [Phycisphaerales bacterium]|nr:hypothetical protein [Phycisphaerales bacterium]
MAKTFAGFSKKMPAFFRGLARNNTREWFAPRKELFETEVRGPMIELVSLVNEDLRRFAIDNVVADPKRAIYRLYRDTRFSKDKTPYKTHIGATFPRRGLPKHAGAGFYFGVSHEHVEVAGGMYMPGPEELAAVRRAIAADSGRFLKLVGDKRLVKKVGAVLGEKLKRPTKGFDNAPAAVSKLLKHKQMYFFTTLDAKLALSSRVRREVVERFAAMAEVMEWFNDVLLEAARAAEGEEPRAKRPEPMW